MYVGSLRSEGSMMSRVAVAFLMLLLVAVGATLADETVISLNALSPLTENFDSMGSASVAPLPVGWQFNQGSGFSGQSTTTRSAGTTGDSAINSGSPGGFYNFGDGVNALAIDRAAGF